MATLQGMGINGAAPEASPRQGELLLSEQAMAEGYLPRVLTTTDLSAIFIAVIVFISNAAVVPLAGAAAFTYWALGFVTFLIPGVILTADLGRMFPGEGSVYLWTTKTFGAFWGFFAGFCHWFPGLLVLVSTSSVVVATIQLLPTFVGLNQAWLIEPWQQGLVILLVLLFSLPLATMRLQHAQAIVKLVVFAYLGAILLVGLAGVFWLLGGQPAQADFSSASWQMSQQNWAFYGTVILALLGFELPLTMGAEIRSQDSTVRHLIWGAIGVMLAYLMGTFGVMVVVPQAEFGNPAAVPDVVARAFGAPWGVLVSVIILGFFLVNTGIYNYVFARTLLVAGLDRRLPARIAALNASRQPGAAAFWQATIAALFTLIAFLVVPYVFNPGASQADKANLTSEVYNVFQAAVTIVWCIAMLLLFIAAPVARSKFKERSRFAGLRTSIGFLWLCALIGMAACIFGIWTTLTGSWVPALISNDRWWYIVIVACFAGLDAGLLLTFFLTGRPAVEQPRRSGRLMSQPGLLRPSAQRMLETPLSPGARVSSRVGNYSDSSPGSFSREPRRQGTASEPGARLR